MMRPALPLRCSLPAVLGRWRAALLIGLTLLLAGGCATTGTTGPGAGVPHDPWEPFNRKVYAFNDAVDEAVLKPVATTYVKVVPQLVRTGISNVLGNLADVWSVANHLLQGKVQVGMEMGMRVLTNTFFGLGGLLDPATEMGLTRRPEDFGQTLGRWGMGPGPFIMLPFLGPSTLRDTGGWAVDRSARAEALPWGAKEQSGLTALEVVNLRAGLLGAGQLLDSAALDRYSFLRDAYLARRLDAVYDGAPPLQDFDDFDDDDEPPAAAAAPAAAASAAPAPVSRKPAAPPAAQRP